MKQITSRDNPRLKTIRRLAQDSQAYRKLGLVWMEGDHLCRAALSRGVKPELAVFSDAIWQASAFEWAQCADENMGGARRHVFRIECARVTCQDGLFDGAANGL